MPSWNNACGSAAAFLFNMAKKIKYHLIKAGRTYTIKEIATVLNCHVRTVQEWIKQGLEVIDRNSKPYLISGRVAKQFLKQKSDKFKVKLKKNELYCLKCRAPRESLDDELRFEYTGKLLGNGERQVSIKGLCPICSTVIQRFSSNKGISNLYSLEKLRERGLILIETDDISLNTDMNKEKK